MSVEHAWKRRGSGEHPSELVLTITVTGAHDIYRFAHHLLFGQVEFVELGQKIIDQLRRRMGRGRWSYIDRSMGGWRTRGAREPQPVGTEADRG
jgi:hypothetical protein